MTTATMTHTPILKNLSRSGEDRRDAGRTHFTCLLSRLLTNISHPELALLADWACNETGNLHTSQISHLRNAKMRMLGVKSLDGLSRVNCAAYEFKRDRSDVFRQMGTAQTTARIEEILDRFTPILHPDSGAPLNAGDFMLVYLGYIEIDLPTNTSGLDQGQLDKAALEVGPWFESLLEEKGVRMRDALKEIGDNWEGDAENGARFCQVIAGLAEFTPDELSQELPAIAQAAGRIIDEEISTVDLIEMINA